MLKRLDGSNERHLDAKCDEFVAESRKTEERGEETSATCTEAGF